ncbi:hypothetical protein PMI13_01126 [Chryseobacterium populi]|uniref:Uncharacterized protein n=1 Tax=Chryseobacterium populi TaxID=1144316 RepID=J2T8G6_9FLAO|nr:hypothetical protein PMI13_01126 [Chryseobacterium populi]
MDKSYLVFQYGENNKSEVLARELNISRADFINIENWFDLLLFKHIITI